MKQILIILAAMIVFTNCDDSTPIGYETFDSLNYNVYFGDRIAGFQNSWRDSKGAIWYVYEFNDRGRGPHIEVELKLNKNGLIRYQHVSGHNYYKERIGETFKVENGKASWSSTIENGETAWSENSMYTSLSGAPGISEINFNQLIKSKDRKLSLLPEGSITLNSVEKYQIGDSVTLKLAEVTGFGFNPGYTWYDEDNRFFASVSSWFSCIRAGNESLRAELIRVQEEKQKQYLTGVADDLTEIPSGKIIINNVSIFNSNKGSITDPNNVVIEGNKIRNITTEEIEPSENDRIIDGSGLTLLPGLFDNHVHIDKTAGLLHIACGVTSVRDMANSLNLPDLKSEFDQNKVIGPRIVVMSGFVDQAGPYAGPTGKIVKTLDEGLDGIQFYKDKGYQQIKLYSSIDLEWVKPLAQKAHDLGMRVSGHIPSYMLAEQAVNDGYDEIQHVNMIALNFLPDTIDTRTPLRFSMVAEHTHALDLNSPEFRKMLNTLKSKNTVVDPTVSIFESMFVTKPGQPDPSFSSILDRLPVQVKRNFYGGGLPIPKGKEEQFKNSYQKLLDIVKALHDNGIIIIPGTDAMAGFGLHTELENYVRAGIPANEVLKLATLVSARVANVDHQLGSVEVGKLADVILVDGNPVEDIANIRNIKLTIKDGNIYQSSKLLESVGIQSM